MITLKFRSYATFMLCCLVSASLLYGQKHTPTTSAMTGQIDLSTEAGRKKILELDADNNSSIYGVEIGSSNLTKVSLATECFWFRIKYPFSVITYEVDNMRYNGKRLLSLDSADNSSGLMRTRNFQAKANDTICFFRQLTWISEASLKIGNGFSWSNMANNYQAFHELSWSIELISNSSGKRILLIDSIKIASRASAGVPQIFGTSPAISKIQFVIPQHIKQQNVYVRITPFAINEGSTSIPQFSTKQNTSLATDFERQYLARPDVQEFATMVSGYTTLNINLNSLYEEQNKVVSFTAQITPNPTSRDVIVSFTSPKTSEYISASIYDNLGRRIVFWSNLHKSYPINYSFESSGLYHIVVRGQNGDILTCQKILVH